MNPERRPPLLLLVDDVAENIQVAGSVLREEDVEIVCASNGVEARAIAAEDPPDLILLDVLMPDLDGYETCRRLKADRRLADIPVIFLTARAETEALTRGFALGAVDYITKPFNADELRARVRTHLDLARHRAALEQVGRERKEMLHVLCHDLVTTLGNIQMLATPELAAAAAGNYDPRELIRALARNGLDLIDMVRRMRALEEFKLPLGPVALDAAFALSARILKPQLDLKGVKLAWPADTGLRVIAEMTSLVNSVINNLLTNALKFSLPDSSITLAAERAGKRVRVTVRDQGIGIPPAILRDLFDISKKTSRTGTAGEIGTGFGMPLVQRFMHFYGGEIEVRSRDAERHPEDHGTEVILTFQAADTE